jgi:acyl-CoA synthetase (AMP-forming)/AMP-acid ligase II/acyl carrier protein
MSAVVRRAGAESLVSVLRRRAQHQPERLAYVFCSEGNGEVRLSYAELDRRVRNVAACLEKVASSGDCVLLLYPPGLDFLVAFLACLYSDLIGIPLFAPRPNREDPRLSAITEDSGAQFALTLSRAVPDRSGAEFGGRSIEYVFTDRIEEGLGQDWREPSATSREVAYLQYTSGSTSAPKGVMVTHQNLLYNCSVMQECWQLSEQTVSVSWLPHFHDMGLIEGLLNPLYVGFPAVLMPPAQFVARPMKWLQLITRFRATHSGAPNFAYDLCVEKIRPEQRAELDLSSWTLAYSGAEPINVETLNRFAEFFAPCGFHRRALSPGYGLAEATLMVSAAPKSWGPTVKDVDVAHMEKGLIVPANGGKSRQLVGCGRVGRTTHVAIVDPETFVVCPESTIGEIWVSGPTVANGYWGQPEKSRETFNAFTSNGDGPYLRTGDLGFLSSRELFVTGRLKDLIIIRGANYYPQDIEATVEKAHPALRSGYGAAFSIEVDSVESLAVAYEIDRQYRGASAAEFEGIATAIRQAVHNEFDLDIYAVRLLKVGSVPKTSSGKIQRKACRANFLNATSEYLFESRLQRARQNSVDEGIGVSREELLALSPADRTYVLEDCLRRLIASVLHIPSRQFDRTEPLGSYGLESLRSNQLIAVIEDALGVSLPPTTIFNYPTLAELSRHLAALMDFKISANDRADRAQHGIQDNDVIEEARLAEIVSAIEKVSISELEEMIAKTRRTLKEDENQ